MIEFFIQNGGTILVSLILMLVVVFNVKKLCREKSTCGCSCKDCPSGGACCKNLK